MAGKLLQYTAISVAIFLVLTFSVFMLQESQTAGTLIQGFNSIAGRVTGFSIAGQDFTISGGHKPIAGYVYLYDNSTLAENASVVVYVNVSIFAGNFTCHTDPPVLTGSGNGSAYATTLSNLKYPDNSDCSAAWSAGDPIWAEANGSTMYPPQGYGISAIDSVESGVGTLQYLDNFTLSQGPDIFAPNITLVSPANNTNETANYTITFQYNVSDDRNLSSCSLYINSSLDQTDSSPANNAVNSFTKTLYNGNYDWFVNCSDQAGNSNVSQTWFLTVSLPNSPPQFTVQTRDYSTVTSPTNINTNVTFTATAADYDLDTYQLVICNSSSISQAGVCAQTQICSSSFVAQNTQASCQHSTAGEIQQSYTWFSFVCDSQNCSDYNNTNSPYYVNHYPTYTAVPDQTWPEDTNQTLNLSDYFSDPDNNTLNYTSPAIQNISVSINNNNKIATFIPDPDFYGIRTVNFTATDPFGLSNTSNTFNLNVTNVNDAPSISGCTNPGVDEDTNPPDNWVNLSQCTTDIDNSPGELTWNIQSQTNPGLISCAIANNYYLNCTTPAANQSGTSIVTVNVTDSSLSDTTNITVTVNAVNDPPYWNQSIPDQQIAEDSGTSPPLDLAGYGADVDNTSLIYVVTSENTSQVDCQVTGSVNLTFTPASNYYGTAQCGLKVYDGLNYSSEMFVNINVTSVNDAPTLTSVSLNPNAGRNGTLVNVTTAGAGDIENDNLILQCGDSSGNYNLCTSAPGQPELSCTFTSPWTDDSSHTVYCLVNDTLNTSAERTASFSADNTPPNQSNILNVEGDTAPKYWDTDNDGNTIVQLSLAESNMDCRWDTADLTYSQMNSSNACTVVGTTASCNVAPSLAGQTNQTTRYISCQDQYGNQQNTANNTDVSFGADWTSPSVNDNNDGQIHLPGYNVTLTIRDQPLGTTVYVYYCNDTANTCQPSASFTGTNGSQTTITFNQRGTWYLRYNATDDAGNINTTKFTVVFINSLPSLSTQTYTDNPGHIFTAQVNVSDVDSSQNITCTLYHSPTSAYTPKPMVLIAGLNSNGTWAANLSSSEGYNVSDLANTYVTCNDTLETSSTAVDNHSIPNFAPGAPAVDLQPDLASSTDDLTCYITSNSTDPDNDNVSYYYQWYNASQLMLTYGPTTQTSHVLGTGNTSNSETWNCTITPFDTYTNGTSDSDTVQLSSCQCPTCNPPIINTTIPNQKRSFNQGNFTLDLSSYKTDAEDSGSNLTWSVQGVNPLFMDVLVSGDIITFAPQEDVSGLDKIVFVLTDTDSLTDTQEITVSINRTITLKDNWNLFSVPILENKSVQYVLSPLGNGNYGCGHDNTPPYDCVPTDGDFAGNWTIIWTQNSTGSWIYFRPDVYYTQIAGQPLQTLDANRGYWLNMNLTAPINLTLEYE